MAESPKRNGLLTICMTLPPAQPVFAGISTLLSLGRVGAWLERFWFPVTRALWQRLFDVIAWTPSPRLPMPGPWPKD